MAPLYITSRRRAPELEVVEIQLARKLDAQVARQGASYRQRGRSSILSAGDRNRTQKGDTTYLVAAKSQHRPDDFWFVIGFPSFDNLTLKICCASS